MSQALTFNEVQLAPILHNNQPWIRSAELARALAYSDERKVTHLYNRHSDEFSNNMSVVLNLGTAEQPAMTRIFSLRGCHLLAMFARTSVAKAFRVWVLDVLETLNRHQAPALDTTSRLSTVADTERKALNKLVKVWAGILGGHQGETMPRCNVQVAANFGKTTVDEMTVEEIRAAIVWVQGKIDALQMPTAVLELPSEPASAAMLRAKCDELRRAMWNAGEISRSLWDMASAHTNGINCEKGVYGTPRYVLMNALHKTCETAFMAWEYEADAIAHSVKAMRILAEDMR